MFVTLKKACERTIFDPKLHRQSPPKQPRNGPQTAPKQPQNGPRPPRAILTPLRTPPGPPLGAASWPQVGPKLATSWPQVGRKTLQDTSQWLRRSLLRRRRLEDRSRSRKEARLRPPRRPNIALPPRRRADFVISAPYPKRPPPEAQIGPKFARSRLQVGPKLASKWPRSRLEPSSFDVSRPRSLFLTMLDDFEQFRRSALRNPRSTISIFIDR